MAQPPLESPPSTEGPAHDRFGRRIHYLRISLLDRCNLRCVYCMPEEGVEFLPSPKLLQDDEIVRIVRAAVAVGFTKFRLTGGEPTLRRGLVDLVRRIREIPGVEELTMTTNGLLLERLARPLAEAGLDRVNVSLDTLDPGRFRDLTRGGDLAVVWRGIRAAEEAGLGPIKINSVVLKGHNEGDLPAMAGLSLDRPWHVRFIEVMPLGENALVARRKLVPLAEMRRRVEAVYGPLEPLETDPHDAARLFRIPGARGTVGFISTISEPFCAGCNRMRLTADGRLRLCLLSDLELDLRGLLRHGADDEALQAALRRAVWNKPWGHRLEEGVIPKSRVMSQIGG